jgi:hypothetical protein
MEYQLFSLLSAKFELEMTMCFEYQAQRAALDIETVNPTCVEYLRASKDSAFAIQ